MNKTSIQLGDLCVSRLMAGGNPISGFSHQSGDRDREMMDYFTAENVKKLWRECESLGIDAVVARTDAFIIRMLREFWNEGGKIKWIAQTADDDSFKNIDLAVGAGASAVYIHGGVTDKIFSDGREKEFFAIVAHGKKRGVPTGIAAHDPLNHLRLREMEVPNDFHVVSLYNLRGYATNTRPDTDAAFHEQDRAAALDAARRIELPCILYKILGAGRKTIEDALTDIRPAIKPSDGVNIGMYPKDDPDMVRKNAEAVFGLPQ